MFSELYFLFFQGHQRDEIDRAAVQRKRTMRVRFCQKEDSAILIAQVTAGLLNLDSKFVSQSFASFAPITQNHLITHSRQLSYIQANQAIMSLRLSSYVQLQSVNQSISQFIKQSLCQSFINQWSINLCTRQDSFHWQLFCWPIIWR